MRRAEEIARRWMPGTREGSDRPAWAHPADVVALLREMPGVRHPSLDVYYEDVGWLHDIIEDGRKGDGSAVSHWDLTAEGIAADVIEGVLALTHKPGEDKAHSLLRLRHAPARVRIVKLADRICVMREGMRVFKDARWARKVRETREFIFPLADDASPLESAWLVVRLNEALAARSVPPDSR